jgi:hypothetical protein
MGDGSRTAELGHGRGPAGGSETGTVLLEQVAGGRTATTLLTVSASPEGSVTSPPTGRFAGREVRAGGSVAGLLPGSSSPGHPAFPAPPAPVWLNGDMPGGWRIRVAAAVATAAAAVLAWPAPAATAAPGTWGAGQYAYADGTVCGSADTTAPLAAWTVSGGYRAYLTQEVTSTGPFDSAAPPVPSAGRPNPAIDVTPGIGFAGEADIAAVAYLLSEAHQSASATAAAVLAQTDPGDLPTCADRAAAAAALANARSHAGPYEVTVTAGPEKARPGHPVPVQAVVRTAAGQPVPGARVAFSAERADVQTSTAVTDDTGTAHAQVSVHSGAGPAVTVTAATAVATGLRAATITATPSATNPTGNSVPAVYPAAPTRFAGSSDLSVDQSAHPRVSTALESRLVRAASPFTPRADVSGLNGHTANVGFELLGPRRLADRTLCRSLDDAGWTRAGVRVVATTSVTVTGDGTAQGGSLTAATVGCYALRVRVATVDATPPASRTTPLAVLAAVDTTVASRDDQPAVFASRQTGRRLTGTVEVTHDYGIGTDVELAVTGPITPRDGNCTADATAWRGAPHSTVAAASRPGPVSGDGATALQYSAPGPSEVGCYRVEPTVVLAAGGDRLHVAADRDRAAFVLDPTLTATVQQTWSVAPAPVPVQVDVAGLFGLAAHVHTAMYRTAANPAGCTRATFTGTDRAATGPAANVPARPGIVTLTLRSGPTPQVGCYAVVPELTIDAAPHVQIAGRLGGDQAVLIAGIDPNRHFRAAAAHDDSGTGAGFLAAMAALGAVLLAVVARIGLFAYRNRGDDSGSSGNLLDLPEGELPSGS